MSNYKKSLKFNKDKSNKNEKKSIKKHIKKLHLTECEKAIVADRIISYNNKVINTCNNLGVVVEDKNYFRKIKRIVNEVVSIGDDIGIKLLDKYDNDSIEKSIKEYWEKPIWKANAYYAKGIQENMKLYRMKNEKIIKVLSKLNTYIRRVELFNGSKINIDDVYDYSNSLIEKYKPTEWIISDHESDHESDHKSGNESDGSKTDLVESDYENPTQIVNVSDY